MAGSDPAASPCPPPEALAEFCWHRVSDTARAAMLLHLSQCATCRTQAARMMADPQVDGRAPPRDGDP